MKAPKVIWVPTWTASGSLVSRGVIVYAKPRNPVCRSGHVTYRKYTLARPKPRKRKAKR